MDPGGPGDHVGDAAVNVGAEAGGDVEAAGGTDEVTPAGKGARRGLLLIFPVLLGLFFCVLNILVAVRLWPLLLNNRFQGAVSATLITTSFFIGVFLIVYAIILWRLDGHREKGEVAAGSTTNDQPVHGLWYVKCVIVPLVVALAAALTTVWATGTAASVVPGREAPTPCIEVYRDALDIHRDIPNFRMPAGDPDQRRCGVNQNLLRFPPPRPR